MSSALDLDFFLQGVSRTLYLYYDKELEVLASDIPTKTVCILRRARRRR